MFSLFRSKTTQQPSPLIADIHSHLLPGLDDGVDSFEESVSLIKEFIKLGYSKIITTPHVMSDYYRNEPSDIQNKLSQLKDYLSEQKISIDIEAAAEYYLDEELIKKLSQSQSMMTFGDRHLLFETNFLTEPLQLKEFIFTATTQGYRPVLAHPERYQYLIGNIEKVEDLKNRGVLLQVNIPSIIGVYSKPIQKFAIELIDKGWVDFLGSDCHNSIHMDFLKGAFSNRHFIKATQLPLLNRSLSQIK